jgi:acetyl esterase/lipase
LRAWAQQGYVVAAPEFPLTDEAVAGPDLDESDIQQQPADVRFVIDELVARGGPIAAHIDPSRVGVAGHSDGAETALAVSVEPAPVGEPAIRCAIAMSVSPLVGVSHTANPPLLVTQGDADTLNLPSEASQTWQEAASPKYLVILHGAGHLPPLEAGSEWFGAIEAITEDFLNAYLARTGAVSRIALAGTRLPLTSITVG